MKKIIPTVINIILMTSLVLIILLIVNDSLVFKVLLLVLFIAYNFLSAIWNIVEWKIRKENRYIFLAVFNIIILLNIVLYLSNYYSINAYLGRRNI